MWLLFGKKYSNSGGLGAIIRDSSSLVVAVWCDVCFSLGDTSQLYVWAIQKSLCLAKDLGLSRVIVECDRKDVMSILISKAPCLASFGTVVDDICQISSSFSYVHFHFIPSSCKWLDHVWLRKLLILLVVKLG